MVEEKIIESEVDRKEMNQQEIRQNMEMLEMEIDAFLDQQDKEIDTRYTHHSQKMYKQLKDQTRHRHEEERQCQTKNEVTDG